MKQEQEQIVLTLVDNGRGFDPAAVSPQSMGLQSMQERLEEVGGTFQLQSRTGQGTQIVVRYAHSSSATPSEREEGAC